MYVKGICWGYGTEENDATDLVIYPNPVKDMLHVTCDNMQQYEVFSLDGRLVKSMQTRNNEDVIDLSNLGSGIYLIRITTDKGVATRRIIKD